MKFPNVARGVKKIFASEILALIGAICTGLFVLMSVLTWASGSAISDGEVTTAAATGVLAGGLGIIVFSVGAAVLMIIALIFNLIGLNAASKDDPDGSGQQFKIAFIAIIISLITSVVATCLQTSMPTVASTLSIFSNLLNLFATYYTLYGIRDFAEKIGKTDLAETANKLVWAVCALYVFAIVVKAIPDFAKGSIGSTIGIILSLAYIVLSIIQYIVYLSVLAKAKKAFAEN